MWKKIIFGIMLFVMLILLLLFLIIRFNNLERYNQIKRDVEDEAVKYLNLVRPGAYIESTSEEYLNECDITSKYKRGADKKILLDTDKNSYCKVVVHAEFYAHRWYATSYLSCQNYEDKEYNKLRKKVNYKC